MDKIGLGSKKLCARAKVQKNVEPNVIHHLDEIRTQIARECAGGFRSTESFFVRTSFMNGPLSFFYCISPLSDARRDADDKDFGVFVHIVEGNVELFKYVAAVVSRFIRNASV